MLSTTTAPAKKTAPGVGVGASENRAWGFFGDSVRRSWEIDPQVVERHLERTTTESKTAPGVPHWPSRDPIGERGGLNLYGFVYNNPTNYIDVDGRAVWMDPGGGLNPTLHNDPPPGGIDEVFNDFADDGMPDGEMPPRDQNSRKCCCDEIDYYIRVADRTASKMKKMFREYEFPEKWEDYGLEQIATVGGFRGSFYNNAPKCVQDEIDKMEHHAGETALFASRWILATISFRGGLEEGGTAQQFMLAWIVLEFHRLNKYQEGLDEIAEACKNR